MSTSLKCKEFMLTSHVRGKPSSLARRTNATPALEDKRERCTRAPELLIKASTVSIAMVSEATGTLESPMRNAKGPLAATPRLK
jgi:hypothetical protein